MEKLIYNWNLPIGDWSDDGHGKCVWFLISSNFTVEESREAYFKAVKESGVDISKEIAYEYEDSSVSEKVLKLIPRFVDYLCEEGLIINRSGEGEDPKYHVEEVKSMVKIVLLFIKRYTPEFDYKIVENPMLPFYGFDEYGRHIGYFGYGLFWL